MYTVLRTNSSPCVCFCRDHEGEDLGPSTATPQRPEFCRYNYGNQGICPTFLGAKYSRYCLKGLDAMAMLVICSLFGAFGRGVVLPMT